MLDPSTQKRMIQTNRRFTMGYRPDDPYEDLFESDQQLRLPQPPLVKAPIAPENGTIPLCRDFHQLSLENNVLDVFLNRKSSRVYTQEAMTLDQLSFLLWATQGIKQLRGRAYATLRTVPSGGARHPFETYLLVRNVAGLEPGAYHYLPMEHVIEFLHPVENLEEALSDSLSGQKWAAKSAVTFYWSMVAYRAEWRYGIYAHRVALIDVGHLGQNLYMACSALGLGTCGIAAFSHENCCQLFTLDGEDEYIVYTAPVGCIRAEDAGAEKAFYQFVEDQNL